MDLAAAVLLPLHDPPLDAVEVAAWCALVDAWVHVDCPSRCPKVSERGDLRAEVERLRRSHALTIADADIPRVQRIFTRFDAVVMRFAEATRRRPSDPWVVYVAGALLELALHDQPAPWARLLKLLRAVGGRMEATFPTATVTALCQAVEESFGAIRTAGDEEFAAWVRPASADAPRDAAAPAAAPRPSSEAA